VRLESWSWGCEQSWSKKVLETFRILEGWVSAGLNVIAVLCTMVEWRVQLLKLWARLLCDYAMLEASEVTKRVTGLVTPATVVAVENAMEAFSANYRPNW
jgi:hypothetical protein